MRPHSDPPSTSTYIKVFAGLGALTALNVALSYVPRTSEAGVGATTVVATIQVGMIAHYLMHLRGENRVVTYTILAAVFLLVSLFGTLVPDIGF